MRELIALMLSISAVAVPAASAAGGSASSNAEEQVDAALAVVERMKRDPDIAELLRKARGIFIVPDYQKAAAIFGGEGGECIALLRTEGSDQWTAPVFFNFGRASIGPEPGGKGGSAAMLLMSEKAAEMFTDGAHNWSLDADAGLAIVNYSAAARASIGKGKGKGKGKGDVIVWSDTEGASAGADVGISGIHRDRADNAAFYGKTMDPRKVFAGKAFNERAEPLRQALAG